VRRWKVVYEGMDVRRRGGRMPGKWESGVPEYDPLLDGGTVKSEVRMSPEGLARRECCAMACR